MAQPLSLLAATQAGVSPGEAGEALPADLIALSLEQLMALPVGGRAPQDPDDALEGLAASGALAGVATAARGPEGKAPDLPADLTALSLLQLMNVPVSDCAVNACNRLQHADIIAWSGISPVKTSGGCSGLVHLPLHP